MLLKVYVSKLRGIDQNRVIDVIQLRGPHRHIIELVDSDVVGSVVYQDYGEGDWPQTCYVHRIEEG